MRLDMTGAPWGSSHSEPVRAGGLLFESDPRASELSLRAKGYAKP